MAKMALSIKIPRFLDIFFFHLLRVVFHIVVTDFIERLSVLSIKEI